MKFGFVVLSHRSPEQLGRLVRTLGRMYGDPPIACHHDFSQAELDRRALPGNVRLVTPHLRTGWGKWSLVEATLRGLDTLYQAADPDYFFLISAVDYPAAKPAKVLRDLEESGADVWLDAFNLQAALAGRVETGEPHLAHHRSPGNISLAKERYLQALIKVPIVRFKPPRFSSTLERYPRLGRETLALPFQPPTSPFRGGFDCWVGSQWFTGTRKAARKLIEPDRQALRLRRHLQSRVVPDECYVQSVLCNDPSIRRSGRTFRLAFWEGGGAHPRDIGPEHLPVILAEQPHFVRKMPDGSAIADALNAALGLPAAPGAASK